MRSGIEEGGSISSGPDLVQGCSGYRAAGVGGADAISEYPHDTEGLVPDGSCTALRVAWLRRTERLRYARAARRR